MKSCGTLGIMFHARSIWRSPTLSKNLKIKVVWKFEWCLYDINAYVCNLEIKLRWNKLLCLREIVNRHFESKECFSRLVAKFYANFSQKQRFQFSLLSDPPIIITSMPMFATYRVKVEGIISKVLTAVLRESRGWKLCTLQVWVCFPNFLLVIEICLHVCIPVQIAYCERGNSCLHRIMCDFQSTLGVSLLWKHSCAFLLMVLFLRSIITDWQDENKRTKKLGSQIWEKILLTLQ